MSNFDRALKFVLSHEGGWADNPDDFGGPTNFGITLNLAKRYGIETGEELQSISQDKVRSVYQAEFWRHSLLADEALACHSFDFGVTVGLADGIRLLQRSACFLGVLLKVDGVLGPKSIAGIKTLNIDQLRNVHTKLVCSYYIKQARKPNQLQFLNSWIIRAVDDPMLI